jgi:membrane protease subunit HflC
MSLAKNKIILIISFVCFLFIAYNSVYTVLEGRTALLSPCSVLEKANLLHPSLQQEPGLHFKLPFLVRTTLIDRRLHNVSFNKLSILTTDQQPLVVDYYASWYVTQPMIYYLQTHNDFQETKQQITQKINILLQNAFAHNKAILVKEQALLLNTLVIAPANKQLTTLGITLVDVGFKSIDFPAGTHTVVLQDLKKEQMRVALAQRIIGKSNAENIRTNADNQVALQLAKANVEAAVIRGQGDASAAKIYSEAYRKNPQFAAFYLNLEAYRKGFMLSSPSNNFLVLNAKNGLFNVTTFQTHSKDLG